MAKCAFICIFLLASAASYGQWGGDKVVAIAFTKVTYAYSNIDNPLSIVMENTEGKMTHAASEKGELRKYDSSKCMYTYWPGKAGRDQIIVWKENKGVKEVTREFKLRVGTLPQPEINVGGVRGTGVMHASVMRLQIAPSANFGGFEFDVKKTIYKFRMIVVADSEIIFDKCYYDWNGARFEPEVVNQLIAGYTVWITDAYVRWQNGMLTKAKGVKITLK